MSFSQKNINSGYKIWIFFICGIFLGVIWTILFLKSDFFSTNKGNSESFSQNLQVSDNVKNSEIKWFFSLFNKEKWDVDEKIIFHTPKIQSVYEMMQKNFYWFDQKTKTEVEDAMLHSLVTALGDKYSEYFSFDEAKTFNEALSGELEGIGAVVDENPEGIILQRILDNSPAQKAGLQVGDIVVQVKDTRVAGMKTTEAVKLIRWKAGTSVKIIYKRGEEEKVITVTREAVNLPSVDSKILENTHIGYVQINTFGTHTSEEFQKAIASLQEKNVEGIILDFRFNVGGFLGTAQDLLSVFFDPDTLLVTSKSSNIEDNRSVYSKKMSVSASKIPIVVLVNGFSASASEIFAGAIQDYSRGVLVGEKTFGKWSVQGMFDLSDGSMVKFTVAKWYTPKDKNIDETGINPDIEVKIQEEDYKNKFDRQLDVAKKIMMDLLKTQDVQKTIENNKNL